jgi:hypothetical protein
MQMSFCTKLRLKLEVKNLHFKNNSEWSRFPGALDVKGVLPVLRSFLLIFSPLSLHHFL